MTSRPPKGKRPAPIRSSDVPIQASRTKAKDKLAAAKRSTTTASDIDFVHSYITGCNASPCCLFFARHGSDGGTFQDYEDICAEYRRASSISKRHGNKDIPLPMCQACVVSFANRMRIHRSYLYETDATTNTEVVVMVVFYFGVAMGHPPNKAHVNRICIQCAQSYIGPKQNTAAQHSVKHLAAHKNMNSRRRTFDHHLLGPCPCASCGCATPDASHKRFSSDAEYREEVARLVRYGHTYTDEQARLQQDGDDSEEGEGEGETEYEAGVVAGPADHQLVNSLVGSSSDLSSAPEVEQFPGEEEWLQ